MIFLQTIGSVDMPGSGPRKMPSPRAYLAPIFVYLVLTLVADTGHGRERLASAAGWLIVLTSLVKGPASGTFGTAGTRLINLFTSVANIASVQTAQSAAADTTTTQGN